MKTRAYTHTHTHTHTHTNGWVQLLPDYFAHMRMQPDSLLCRFFGLFRIKPQRNYLLVMANVLDTVRDIHMVRM
jgi:hypothetical protein